MLTRKALYTCSRRPSLAISHRRACLQALKCSQVCRRSLFSDPIQTSRSFDSDDVQSRTFHTNGSETSDISSQRLSGRDFINFAFSLHESKVMAAEQRLENELEAEARQRGLTHLPALPEKPRYPCPYLTNEEINSYLVPLYERGWFVGSSLKPLKDADYPPENIAPELVKTFRFAQEVLEEKLAFVRDVAKLQTEENHHCTTSISQGTAEIRTHTHSARPLPAEGTSAQPPQHPGITLRDVRLAILVESAFEGYLTCDIADWKSQLRCRNQGALPLTAHDVERLRRAERAPTEKCPVCYGPHPGIDCPKKEIIPPRTPCMRCGDMHWSFMCKETSRWSGPRCPVCKGAHEGINCPKKDDIPPREPCRCGQMHWSFMCNVSQPSSEGV